MYNGNADGINYAIYMPLEKYEDFLKLSIKQLVIQTSPISLGQTMCGV